MNLRKVEDIMIVINFKEGYAYIPLKNTGYGYYVYMLTDITNNMRYINTYTGYPNKEDIYEEITEKPIYEAILKKGLNMFKLEILCKASDDLYLHEIVKIYINRYLICGLYNENYYNNDNSIICIETRRRFDNPNQAGNAYNIDGSAIRKVLKGQRKSAGGYTWKYYRDYLR